MQKNEKHSKTKEIALGEDFGDVAVSVNGIRIEVCTDGSVLAYTDGPVNVRPADNDNAQPKVACAPEIGDPMPDGSIFAGLSPDTNQPMYVTPKDAPLTTQWKVTMQWKAAIKYAADLTAHGHSDWRVPSKSELNVLFENCAAIGGFDRSSSLPAGYYWSSSEGSNGGAWSQKFSEGLQNNVAKSTFYAVRCVRSIAP